LRIDKKEGDAAAVVIGHSVGPSLSKEYRLVTLHPEGILEGLFIFFERY
jgi:hypothetical protein